MATNVCDGRFCGRNDHDDDGDVAFVLPLRSVRCISSVETLKFIEMAQQLNVRRQWFKERRRRHKLCSLETTRPNDSDNKWCKQCKSQNAPAKNRAEKALSPIHRLLHPLSRALILIFYLHSESSVNSKLKATLLWYTDRQRRVMLNPTRNSHSSSRVLFWCE